MIQLVGILNVTPDSFSDGGQFLDPQAALAHADQLFKEGAALIDVGAESTRPNAKALTATEEWARLEPIILLLLLKYPGKLSVDTYHPETVNRVLDLGEVIVNDVTGMNNPKMVKAVVAHHASVIISHLPAQTTDAAHKGTLISDVNVVLQALLARDQLLQTAGLRQDQIILDPGIGFGKTPELNAELVSFAQYLPGRKVMIGYSRKRFLGDNRMLLEPNLQAGREAVASGATYLRVHDVAGHRSLLI
jgi:dihydropteroate synthase